MNPAIILQALSGATLLFLGIGVLAKPAVFQQLWQATPSGKLLRSGLALLAVLSALAMGAAIAVPFLAFFAACLAALAALAFAAATFRGAPRYWPLNAGLLVASIAIAVLQPLGLRVMLLPRADVLPYAAAPAQTIKTYDPGFGFESVRVGADGTLYLAATASIDPSASDYDAHARGVIIARDATGAERTIFTTPEGYTGQVMAIAKDGTIYMTGSGKAGGVWRVEPGGKGRMFTDMPAGAWPNGIDWGPDGNLYSADSALGLIWRIDPRSGHSVPAFRDAALTRRNSITLAPGANGLRFHGADMYVTVSDRATVLRYRFGSDGRFSPAKVIATGVPGDDLAIGPDGSLFVTTHVYDTLVRIAPNGERTMLGDARQQMTGATDASFGQGANDRDTLYVATDGGRFTQGAQSPGRLVATQPYAN
jgi:sugar lactone lactonase YvrE